MSTRQIDPETGEILDSPKSDVHTAAMEAAQAYVAWQKAQMDVAAVQAEIDAKMRAMIEEHYPAFADMQAESNTLEQEWKATETLLRDVASNLTPEALDGKKSTLNGAVTIAETEREVHFDETLAIQYALEMGWDDSLKIAKSAWNKRTKGAELPPEISRREIVREVRLKLDKLAELAQ